MSSKETIVALIQREVPGAQLAGDGDIARPMREIGIDSVDTMMVLLAVQETLGVVISDEDLAGLRSVSDLIELVDARRADG